MRANLMYIRQHDRMAFNVERGVVNKQSKPRALVQSKHASWVALNGSSRANGD